MRKFVAGLIVGLTLAGSVQAQRFAGFMTVPELLRNRGTEDRIFSLGYVAGIADTYHFVGKFFEERKTTTLEEDFADIDGIRECLALRGTSLGTLNSFAHDAWREVRGDLLKETGATILSAACAPDRR